MFPLLMENTMCGKRESCLHGLAFSTLGMNGLPNYQWHRAIANLIANEYNPNDRLQTTDDRRQKWLIACHLTLLSLTLSDLSRETGLDSRD